MEKNIAESATDNSKHQRKCINCAFFDSRTSFCRKSPPQVVINTEGFYVAVFPKISMPLLDFCFEHKQISEQQNKMLLI